MCLYWRSPIYYRPIENAQQGVRANGKVCHESCCRAPRAPPRQGSSLTFCKDSMHAQVNGCDCREKFRETAVRYRVRSRLLSVAVYVGLAFWIFLWFPSTKHIGIAGFLVCWAVGFFGSIFLLRLTCPLCAKSLDRSAGKFCPECGVAALKDADFWSFRAPQCSACGVELARGRGGRRFKIRFCSECGAHVDDQGL